MTQSVFKLIAQRSLIAPLLQTSMTWTFTRGKSLRVPYVKNTHPYNGFDLMMEYLMFLVAQGYLVR